MNFLNLVIFYAKNGGRKGGGRFDLFYGEEDLKGKGHKNIMALDMRR